MPERSKILQRYGLRDGPNLSIEPQRDDDGSWHIRVSSPGIPDTLIEVGTAKQVADELRAFGEVDLALAFEVAVERANDFAEPGR